MRVLHLNYSDINGGAARAAYRIHRALLSAGIESRMAVEVAHSDDWTVRCRQGNIGKSLAQLRMRGAGVSRYLMRSGNLTLHSPALLNSDWPHRVSASDADVVHLHWVQAEMLSVADIARIRKPLVWTLHDMWAFCGAEHYSDDRRWLDGYRVDNRPAHEKGFDLNRFVWRRKKSLWRRSIQVVAPSTWLADCAKRSQLMHDWPVDVVPHPIDPSRWRPIDRIISRQLHGLPSERKLVLFGAVGGGSDPRKGFDLLVQAIRQLRARRDDLQLVVFGQEQPQHPLDLGFPVRYIGRLQDDLSLALLYSAADVMVVPSRQEAFGQTALEAHACGAPVVAFRVGGLRDIVGDHETGYLAEPFSSGDLAAGIDWVLENLEQRHLRENAVSRAKRLSDPASVASAYQAIYQLVLSRDTKET